MAGTRHFAMRLGYRVVRSLYERAVGYSYDAEEVMQQGGGAGC
jgi:hypothetical protein